VDGTEEDATAKPGCAPANIPYTRDKRKLIRDIERRKDITDMAEVEDLLFRIAEASDSIRLSLESCDPATASPEWIGRAERALISYQSAFRKVDRHRNDLIRQRRTPAEIEGIRHKAFVRALMEMGILSARQWSECWRRADELVR
jgi:hypothetical protein